MLASQRHEAAQTPDLSCLCCLEAVNLRRQEVQEARPFLCMTHTHSGLQITEIRKDFTGFIVIYNRRQLTGAIKLCQDWLNVFFRLLSVLSSEPLSEVEENLCSVQFCRP